MSPHMHLPPVIGAASVFDADPFLLVAGRLALLLGDFCSAGVSPCVAGERSGESGFQSRVTSLSTHVAKLSNDVGGSVDICSSGTYLIPRELYVTRPSSIFSTLRTCPVPVT